MIDVASRNSLSLAFAGERAKLASWPNGRRTIGFALIAAVLATALFLLTVATTTGRTLAVLTPRQSLEVTLIGVDVANIATIILAVLFVAEETRTRLVEVTVALTPRRHNIVLAKALLMAAVACAIAVVATVLVVVEGMVILTLSGAEVSPPTEGWALRMIFGTMLMLPMHAVLGVCFAYLLPNALLSFLGVFGVMSLPSLATLLPLELGRAAQFLLITPAVHTISGVSQPGDIDYTSTLSAILILAAWIGLAIPAAIMAFRARDV
jgi:ABC-2 type transport system permease protein